MVMMLKMAGSICVLTGCIGFVRNLLRTGNVHRKMLQSFAELAELLAAEIRYERLPICDILQQMQQKVRPEIAAVLVRITERMTDGTGIELAVIWSQEFCKAQRELLLKKEELEEVCRMGKHLGFLDQKQQEQHLKGCAERLKRLTEQAQKELEEKKRIYRYLGMAAGFFIILILI